MNNITATIPLPTVPPEVRDFADDMGLGDHLGAVIDVARRAFPSSTLYVALAQDGEDETHRYIALDVEAGRLTTEALLAGQRAWSAGVPHVCPSRLAVYFVLGWR